MRACVNRLSVNTKRTIAEEMADSKAQGIHHVTIGANVEDVVEYELKYKQITVLPPIGKQKNYPSLLFTVIHAGYTLTRCPFLPNYFRPLQIFLTFM